MVCAFCPNCGTRLYHAESHESGIISLKAGSLDDSSWLRPVGHIWTRSAQPWLPLDRMAGPMSYEREPERDDELIDHYRTAGSGES